MTGLPLVPAICPIGPNPIDELNQFIKDLEDDMKKNPQNAARDQEEITLDQQELSLEKEYAALFLSGDTSDKCNQLQYQIMLDELSKEKLGSDAALLETPAQLDNGLLCYLVAQIREKDPHFAPMGTEQGAEDLAALQQYINSL